MIRASFQRTLNSQSKSPSQPRFLHKNIRDSQSERTPTPRGKENQQPNLTPSRSPNRLQLKQKPSVDLGEINAINKLSIRSSGFKNTLNYSPLNKVNSIDNLNSESMSPEHSQSMHQSTCVNHPNKQAKYRTMQQQDEQPYLYCSKCAIRLVSQGFKVQQIKEKSSKSFLSSSNQEEQVSRGKQINLLLSEIQEIKPVVQKNLHHIRRGKDQFVAHHKRIIRAHDKAFDNIIQELQRQKQQRRQSLVRAMQKGQQSLLERENNLSGFLQDMSIIRQDIRPNIQKIKKHVSTSQYRNAMSTYKDKIASIRQGCQIEDLDIKFAEVDQRLIEKMEELYRQIRLLFVRKKNSINFSFEERQAIRKQIIPEEEVQEEGEEGEDEYEGHQEPAGSGYYSPNFKDF